MLHLFRFGLFTALILLASSQIKAQSFDFDRLVKGKVYEFMLTDNSVITGKLVSVDNASVTIMQDSAKKTKINKQLIKDVAVPEIWNIKDSSNVTASLRDGSIVKGMVLSSDDNSITLKLSGGSVLKILHSEIESIDYETGTYTPFADPNTTRLLFGPTGRTLKQGEGYFSVVEIFFPLVAYGITDYLSFSGGISIVPGSSDQLYYFNLKGRPLHLENFDLSAGAMYANITDEDASGLFTVYTAGTIGNAKNSLTLGTGFGFESKGGNSSGALFLIGGDMQVSRSVKLITENWLYPADDGAYAISLGARFFGRQLAADFALVFLTDNDGGSIGGWPFIPWLGLHYNF